jgi:glycosyltransferase involved in cell wall biosynthesis
MKIGFFGNQNNYPFTLARAIRRRGHEVLFFIDLAAQLHRPEYRFDDIAYPYPPWVRDVSPFPYPRYAIPNPKRSRILRELNRCDAVVLNNLSPTFLPELDVPGIVLLTGADLDYFSNLRSLNDPFKIIGRKPAFFWNLVIPPAMRMLNRRVIPAQREALRRAVAVSYFWKGIAPHGDRIMEGLVDDDRRIFFMMADLDQIPYEAPRNNDPLRVFCATRFIWKRPLPPGFNDIDDKGSDVMIHGIAEFFRQTGVRLNIRLVRKGMHHPELAQLAEQVGIADQITWLDEMDQKAVRFEFRECDFVFEQFGTSLVGMAGLDALATGRPVIADGRPEIIERAIGAPSPILQAKTPAEVAAQMRKLLDPAVREEIGRRSREHVVEYYSPDHAAALILDRLQPAVEARRAGL